jgi:hypothetical protein
LGWDDRLGSTPAARPIANEWLRRVDFGRSSDCDRMTT